MLPIHALSHRRPQHAERQDDRARVQRFARGSRAGSNTTGSPPSERVSAIASSTTAARMAGTTSLVKRVSGPDSKSAPASVWLTVKTGRRRPKRRGCDCWAMLWRRCPGAPCRTCLRGRLERRTARRSRRCYRWRSARPRRRRRRARMRRSGSMQAHLAVAVADIEGRSLARPVGQAAQHRPDGVAQIECALVDARKRNTAAPRRNRPSSIRWT